MKGDDGQMKGSIANALFDEWTSQQQYNTTDKAILPVEFANVVLGVKTGEESGLAEFNEEEALKEFTPLVTGKELLKKKLIMIPHNTDKHYTLYVLNKYTNSIDILDSLNYRHGDEKKTWKTHHKDHKELIKRKHGLMKKHYGETELQANNEPNWSRIAQTPNRVCVPKQ